jgi:YkoY family integral membrane protein
MGFFPESLIAAERVSINTPPMFGQTFQPLDLGAVGVIVLLETVLSIDNAVVLGLLARRLPESLQRKALVYGLSGAVILRIIALALAAYLLQWQVVKVIGGAYLGYVGIRELLRHQRGAAEPKQPAHVSFWGTVLAIEISDIAFAVDSILAAIALIDTGGRHRTVYSRLWIVLLGGMIGVVVVRMAATGVIRLLQKFPRFETASYCMLIVIGIKLIAEGISDMFDAIPDLHFESPHAIEFWIFWLAMVLCVGIGLLPRGPLSKKTSIAT